MKFLLHLSVSCFTVYQCVTQWQLSQRGEALFCLNIQIGHLLIFISRSVVCHSVQLVNSLVANLVCSYEETNKLTQYYIDTVSNPNYESQLYIQM